MEGTQQPNISEDPKRLIPRMADELTFVARSQPPFGAFRYQGRNFATERRQISLAAAYSQQEAPSE